MSLKNSEGTSAHSWTEPPSWLPFAHSLFAMTFRPGWVEEAGRGNERHLNHFVLALSNHGLNV